MIDVKKLVTGFLILAAVAGSSVFAFANLGGTVSGTSSNPNSANQLADASANQSALLGETNAFSPSSPANNIDTSNVTADQAAAIENDPNNLTSAFASSFLDGLSSANPEGPATDANGNPTVAPPDSNQILSELANNQNIQSLSVPNWDLEAAEQPMHISSDASTASISRYASSLDDVLQKDFVATGIQSAAQNTTPPENISSIASGIASAIQDTTDIPVPSNLADFQKSFVKVLVYEKNVLALAQNPGDDPVKTALVFQAEQSKYQAAMADFSQQFQKAQSVMALTSPTPEKQNAAMALLQSIVGIQTAHAQFGGFFSDLITELETSLQLQQTLWQWVQGILLQVLKNTIVIAIQNNILKFVQNGNNPRFVQQLGSMLLTAFDTAGIKELNKSIPAVYPAYQGAAQTTLAQLYQPFTPTAIITSLEYAVGNNLGQFMGNFTKGGNSWAAYGTMLLPSGNYYGSLFTASQIAGRAAIAQQNSSQAETVASNGFWPIQKCSDNSEPNPADGNVCDNGQPATTLTPGQTINQLVNSATGSDVHLIVNANNIAGLAASILTSLLSKLTNGFTLSGAGAGVPPPAAAPTTPTLPLTCAPANQTVTLSLAAGQQISASFNGSGGAASANSAFPTYTWTASAGGFVSVAPTTGTGFTFTPTYVVTTPGTYNFIVQVAASTGGTATCNVTITANP